MSIYVFLFVASLLCVSQALPTHHHHGHHHPAEAGPEPPNPTPEPNPSGSPDENDGQKRIDELLKQVKSALDAYITPFMVNVTKEDQDVLKNLGLEEFAGSVNYMLYIIQELNDPSYYNSGAIDRNANDVIVEFGSFNPFPDVPFVEQKDDSSK